MTALCLCGCGNPTPLAKETDPRWGHIRGHPVRYISGHHGRRAVEARFWEKVEKGAGPDSCWLWTGAKNSKGYGHIWVSGCMVKAHRVAWELTHGPIPPKTPHVLHNCPGGDNPACVRHLWLGTQADNLADMVAKGRHGRTKLTERQVMAIRERRSAGETLITIASAFGVSVSTICDITTGRARPQVPRIKG